MHADSRMSRRARRETRYAIHGMVLSINGPILMDADRVHSGAVRTVGNCGGGAARFARYSPSASLPCFGHANGGARSSHRESRASATDLSLVPRSEADSRSSIRRQRHGYQGPGDRDARARAIRDAAESAHRRDEEWENGGADPRPRRNTRDHAVRPTRRGLRAAHRARAGERASAGRARSVVGRRDVGRAGALRVGRTDDPTRPVRRGRRQHRALRARSWSSGSITVS